MIDLYASLSRFFLVTRIQINVSWSGSGSGQMIRILPDPDPKHWIFYYTSKYLHYIYTYYIAMGACFKLLRTVFLGWNIRCCGENIHLKKLFTLVFIFLFYFILFYFTFSRRSGRCWRLCWAGRMGQRRAAKGRRRTRVKGRRR